MHGRGRACGSGRRRAAAADAVGLVVVGAHRRLEVLTAAAIATQADAQLADEGRFLHFDGGRQTPAAAPFATVGPHLVALRCPVSVGGRSVAVHRVPLLQPVAGPGTGQLAGLGSFQRLVRVLGQTGHGAGDAVLALADVDGRFHLLDAVLAVVVRTVAGSADGGRLQRQVGQEAILELVGRLSQDDAGALFVDHGTDHLVLREIGFDDRRLDQLPAADGQRAVHPLDDGPLGLLLDERLVVARLHVDVAFHFEVVVQFVDDGPGSVKL